MNQGRVPEYPQIQKAKKIVDRAKKEYLRELISLGYVFETQGMYEFTAYRAIHKDYYETPDERFEDDDLEGTTTPECYPVGAFMRIDSFSERETDDPWETDYFLYENKCSLEYLLLC